MIFRKKIININICIGSYENFLKNIILLSEKKISSYVCVTNVHMLIEAYLDKKFKEVVDNADIVIPDGMPIAKAIKYIYGIDQDRIAGMDLMPDLIRECAKLKKKIFLYGSTREFLEKIEKKAKNKYPNIQIKSYSPPFRKLNDNEKNNIIKMINDYNPDFVFVALGCPKQEKWMAEHKNKIKSCMIGFGGAFEVYAGVKKRAPNWMQKYSLEWLYRLIQDPKRLWKRYIYTNLIFLILISKQFFKYKILKKI
ncbi:WecB/TagA/CpsF family glycosyltransferase [Lebetimonas sp. JH369]|uniref:WecB/TagA/CpsF family glycosyltransferase n=1 Tax=Lebetimonas sp. JH369 TaxID=990069 RepID=UPI000465D810|nr:WecB/TagA/CpsF family glycosyltransferase [Lebetimonas sp. JH369]